MSTWEATHHDLIKEEDVIINPISLTEEERELEKQRRPHDFIIRNKVGESWLQDMNYITVK